MTILALLAVTQAAEKAAVQEVSSITVPKGSIEMKREKFKDKAGYDKEAVAYKVEFGSTPWYVVKEHGHKEEKNDSFSSYSTYSTSYSTTNEKMHKAHMENVEWKDSAVL